MKTIPPNAIAAIKVELCSRPMTAVSVAVTIGNVKFAIIIGHVIFQIDIKEGLVLYICDKFIFFNKVQLKELSYYLKLFPKNNYNSYQ